MGDDSAVFSPGQHCERYWHGQGCPLFDAVHPSFPLRTKASPFLKGALKDGFGDSVVAIHCRALNVKQLSMYYRGEGFSSRISSPNQTPTQCSGVDLEMSETGFPPGVELHAFN